MCMTMKDSLSAQFRDRFQGHEAPVDPGAWQAIQAQLGAGGAADGMNDLFKKRFAEHEVAVDPAVWQGVSGQLGHAAGGFSVGGWIAAGLAGAVVVGGLLFTLAGDGNGTSADKQLAAQTQAAKAENGSEPVALAADEATGTAVVDPMKVNTVPNVQDNVATRKAAIAVRDQEVKPTQPHREKILPGAPKEAVPATGLTPDQKDNAAPGAAVVDEIIAEITQQVQAEVRSTPKVPATQADGTGNPGRTNELLDPEAQHSAIAEPPAQKPFMPNTFTPNNDGVNDDYRISMVGYTSMLLRVYSLKDNRLVFSTNTGEPWTGANCEDGMYLVAVEAMTATGQLVSEGKVVWLNRNGMN